MAQRRNSASSDGGGSRTPTWLYVGLIVLVALVWAVSFIVDAFSKDYEPSVFVHGAFLIVLGAVFGVGIVKGGDS